MEPANSQGQIEQLLRQADKYYAERQWTSVIKIYTQILNLEPSHVPVRVHRGLLEYEFGNPQKAKEDFEYALKIDPGYGLAYYGRGWIKNSKGDYDGELKDAIRGLKLDPENAGMYFRRIGSAYHGLKKYEKAIRAYNEAIKLNTDRDEGTIYNRGLCYFEMGEFKLALADFSRSLELDPDWTWALTSRGRTYIKLQEYERAIVDFSEVIKLQPKNFQGYFLRGHAYYKNGERSKAKTDLKKSLRLVKSPRQRQKIKKLLRIVYWSPVLEAFIKFVREN